jgi:hypothetical protein
LQRWSVRQLCCAPVKFSHAVSQVACAPNAALAATILVEQIEIKSVQKSVGVNAVPVALVW